MRSPAHSILDAIGQTPLVRLSRIVADCPVPIWVKCEHLNPGGSTKDRIAKAIVTAAEQAGERKPGDTLIEATAGNTGVGLALVATSFFWTVFLAAAEVVVVVLAWINNYFRFTLGSSKD